jgi:putative ABC transport system ATP-binding protein
VAIARALVMQPSMILADEPTGNLDSRSSAEIMALFAQLNAQGITVVFVTHEPDIAAHTRRVLHIRDGQLVSDERQQPRPAAVAAGEDAATLRVWRPSPNGAGGEGQPGPVRATEATGEGEP